MHYLIASLLVLAFGPLLYHGLRQHTRFLNGISAFVLVALSGLVLFDILPHLWQQAGWSIIPFVLLGIAGPSIAEKLFSKVSNYTHNITLVLGLVGLLIHTITDGSAVALAQEETNGMLALGVVLHRLPAGLAIWWLLRPAFGRMVAATVLLMMMVLTVIGFLAGDELHHLFAADQLVWLQAFVTGSIMHVLLHRPHEHHHDGEHDHSHSQRSKLSSGHYIGAAIGVLFLSSMMLFFGHSHHDHDDPSGHVEEHQLHLHEGEHAH
ncbi:hypothetical protein [Ferrimonas lipolytica]|uniref:Zinc transporter ZupT n=1 Tax=Ferrimonas lipolytica TaxID=2724191 RepID=A0A6H1UGK9_9GAMM|nr:hypothetical protein [Ferrimonas lipolytica]QIZ78245.1 hypothetical protein HER31_15905 [Ferrimonas lipolytica]